MSLQSPSQFMRIGVGPLIVLAVILCDFTARVQFNFSSTSQNSSTQDISDAQDDAEDSGGANSEEEEHFPVDGNALNSGALPLSEPSARWNLNRRAKARTVERFSSGLRRQLPGWRRIDRVVAESECVSHTLAIMAPAIRSHGPPFQIGRERGIDSRSSFKC